MGPLVVLYVALMLGDSHIRKPVGVLKTEKECRETAEYLTKRDLAAGPPMTVAWGCTTRALADKMR